MKAVKRRIIIVLICVILAIPVTIHAQVNTYVDDAARPVDRSTEIVIKEYSAEGLTTYDVERDLSVDWKEFWLNYMESHGDELKNGFFRYVSRVFPTYPSPALSFRDLRINIHPENKWKNWYSVTYDASGILVMKKTVINEALVSTVDKLSNRFAEGSRFALDKISLFREIDNEGYREEVKDKLTEILLDKGYRVVAKEYFERLLKEQGGYSSGIYNDATTVQNNNFSAVGYLVNVKITESFVRLQVVNVSTGEYEGNVIVNF